MDGRWDHLIPQVAQLEPDFVGVGGEADWAAAVEALGQHSILQGRISGKLALNGSLADCAEATRAALEIAAGCARVVITVAQEIHPGMPVENMLAIINTVKAWQQQT